LGRLLMESHEKIIRMIMKTKRKDARRLVIIPPAQLENILVSLANNQNVLDEKLSDVENIVLETIRSYFAFQYMVKKVCDWAAKSISIWVVLMLVAVIWTFT